MTGPGRYSPHLQEAIIWLSWAEGDLEDARSAISIGGRRRPRWAAACAGQTIEKAIKAGLILRQKDFAKQHDIVVLANSLNWSLGVSSSDLNRISAYNTLARYPDGGGTPPDEAETRAAILIAEKVVRVVKTQFALAGIDVSKIIPV